MNYQLKYALPVIVVLLLLISGCVYFPKSESDIDDQKCQLFTRSLTLDVYDRTSEYAASVNDMHQLIQGNCTEAECLLIVLLTPISVPTSSFILSGSIIVAGNTIHWLEKQGKCPDSATSEAISKLMDSTRTYSGKVIENGNQLIEWMEEQISFGQEYEVIDYEGDN